MILHLHTNNNYTLAKVEYLEKPEPFHLINGLCVFNPHIRQKPSSDSSVHRQIYSSCSRCTPRRRRQLSLFNMAPPSRQSQADAPTELSRKEALGPAEHQQEHGKTRRNNSKSRANPHIDIIEVGSSSGSDSASLGKRSPEPEAREPLGGAELQRPPKFFHEDNGLKGLAGPPPATLGAKEEDGKETVFLRFIKTGDKNPLPDRGSHFSKTGTTGSIPMDDSACGHGLEKREIGRAHV